ncbi:hypothetical protein LCGC14_0436820 [marine sediment metagenome]|uniref:Uncharacterized protein n=1 Tax=marine sediment metagenome TaxID=412755 RepID=A0A0F9VVW7_9ZZZZ
MVDPDAETPIRRPRFTPHPTADEAMDQADNVFAWMDEMSRAADKGRLEAWLKTATDPPASVNLAMHCQQRADLRGLRTELSMKASSAEVAALPGMFAAAAFDHQIQVKAEEEKTKQARHKCVSSFLQRIASNNKAVLLLIGLGGAALILTIAGVFFSNTTFHIGDWIGVTASDAPNIHAP